MSMKYTIQSANVYTITVHGDNSSVHNNRTFVVSDQAYKIKLHDRDANINNYGATYNSGDDVVLYHNDDTNAEKYLFFCEQSDDLEFILEPLSGARGLFVNVKGGDQGTLMQYMKDGRLAPNESRFNVDCNELFYYIHDGEKYKIRNTPRGSDGFSCGYVSSGYKLMGWHELIGYDGDPLACLHDESYALSFKFKDCDNNIVDFPGNVQAVKNNNGIRIPGYGTFNFGRSKKQFYIKEGTDQYFTYDLKATNEKYRAARFNIYKDNFKRFLIQNQKGEFLYLTHDGWLGLTKEATDRVIFSFAPEYAGSTWFDIAFTGNIFLHNPKNMSNKCNYPIKFFESLTTNTPTNWTDMVFVPSGLSNPAGVADCYPASTADLDLTKKRPIKQKTTPDNTKLPVPKLSDPRLPKESFFTCEGIKCFDWYKWVEKDIDSTKTPILAMFKKFISGGNYMFGPNKIFGMNIDDRTTCFGWNRYRDITLVHESIRLRDVLSMIIQKRIGFKYNLCGAPTYQDARQLFMNKDKLMKHNVAALSFLNLMKHYGAMNDNDFNDLIPYCSKSNGANLPLWQFGHNPTYNKSSDNKKGCAYTCTMNEVEVVKDINKNPFQIYSSLNNTFYTGTEPLSFLQNYCSNLVGSMDTLTDATEEIRINENGFVELEQKWNLDDTFNSTEPDVATREELKSKKRNVGKKEHKIKFRCVVGMFECNGGRRKQTTACSCTGYGGQHATFLMPVKIECIECPDRDLGGLTKDKLNEALEKEPMKLKWCHNYGGCNDGAVYDIWAGVNYTTYSLGGNSVGWEYGSYCDYAFGDRKKCGKMSIGWSEKTCYINWPECISTIKSHFKNKSQLGLSIQKASEWEPSYHFCSTPGDAPMLHNLHRYWQRCGRKCFRNHDIALWCRIVNWNDTFVRHKSNIFPEIIYNKYAKTSDLNPNHENREYDFEFEMVIDDVDTRGGTYYSKSQGNLDEVTSSSTSEDAVDLIINDNKVVRVANDGSIAPEDYNKECVKCYYTLTKDIRIFDDRFDHLVFNTISDQNNLTAIVNDLSKEIDSLISTGSVQNKIGYLKVATRHLPTAPDKYVIENPLYPPAFYSESSLFRQKGFYEPDKNLVKINTKINLSVPSQPTPFDTLYYCIYNKFMQNVRSDSQCIVYRLKTGTGNLNPLFSVTDLNSIINSNSFVDVFGCDMKDLSTKIKSNDSNQSYFVIAPKSDLLDTWAKNNLKSITRVSLPAYRKDDHSIELVDKEFELYYTQPIITENKIKYSVNNIGNATKKTSGLRFDYFIKLCEGSANCTIPAYIMKRARPTSAVDYAKPGSLNSAE